MRTRLQKRRSEERLQKMIARAWRNYKNYQNGALQDPITKTKVQPPLCVIDSRVYSAIPFAQYILCTGCTDNPVTRKKLSEEDLRHIEKRSGMILDSHAIEDVWNKHKESIEQEDVYTYYMNTILEQLDVCVLPNRDFPTTVVNMVLVPTLCEMVVAISSATSIEFFHRLKRTLATNYLLLSRNVLYNSYPVQRLTQYVDLMIQVKELNNVRIDDDI